MSSAVDYRDDIVGVDWGCLKSDLGGDDFDNGRSPDQLRRSFERSQAVVVAWVGREVVETARALSDGVCNAYIVDVWTRSDLRRRGIGRAMMNRLLATLHGQHVGLFAAGESAAAFYRALGFAPEDGGVRLVVGRWLAADADPGARPDTGRI